MTSTEMFVRTVACASMVVVTAKTLVPMSQVQYVVTTASHMTMSASLKWRDAAEDHPSVFGALANVVSTSFNLNCGSTQSFFNFEWAMVLALKSLRIVYL